jgi:putative transposase
MSYIQIWLHLIFSTKNREPYITKNLKPKLIEHIYKNAKEKDIHIVTMNGSVEHLHILISLNPEQSIAKVAQLIKGESSYWINKNNLSKLKFEWQDEYMAYSVSKSILEKVKEYISNQEEHHRKKTFKEEYESFIQQFYNNS